MAGAPTTPSPRPTATSAAHYGPAPRRCRGPPWPGKPGSPAAAGSCPPASGTARRRLRPPSTPSTPCTAAASGFSRRFRAVLRGSRALMRLSTSGAFCCEARGVLRFLERDKSHRHQPRARPRLSAFRQRLSHSSRSTRAASSVLPASPPSSAPAKRAGGSAVKTWDAHMVEQGVIRQAN